MPEFPVLVAALTIILAAAINQTPPVPSPPASGAGTKTASADTPPRQWTIDDLLRSMNDLGKGRSWMQGGQVFQQAGCGHCHAMSSYWEGNGLAPDLTSVSSKYTRDIILQSIIEPSATLNGQYYHTEFTLKDGTVVRGSVMNVVNDKLIVAPVMMAPDVTIEIAKADIRSEAPSPVSPMPAGLLNAFTREQILDLMAFLDAGGNADAAIYKQ